VPVPILWVVLWNYLIGQNRLQVGQFVAAVLMAGIGVSYQKLLDQVLYFADARSSSNPNLANAG
jgi:ATP-binding cassette subfamily B protein